jgi:hypothetical protein
MTVEAKPGEAENTSADPALEAQGGEPERKFAGKYKSVEELEKGYSNANEHIERLEAELEQARQEKARMESESRAQAEAQAGDVTNGDRGKTAKVDWRDLWKQGRFEEALEVRDRETEERLLGRLKPTLDRAEEARRAAHETAVSQAMREFYSDSRYPKAKEMEKDMGRILADRTKANPEYARAFRTYADMMRALYAEARLERPDLFQTGKEVAAAAGGGRGTGLAPGRSQEKAGPEKPRTKPETYAKLGLPLNPWQDQEAPENAALKERAAAEAAG